MATTFVITISSGRSTADLARLIKDTTAPRNECQALAHLFERLGSGLEVGSSFDVATSANAPVRAHQSITLSYSDISANDTVTVAGTALTCSGSTTDTTHFKKVTDATATAKNLVTAITTNTTINKLVTATSAAGVVTVTALAPGVIGNKLTLATSNATGFVLGAATLASGAGGYETTATSYSRGA